MKDTIVYEGKEYLTGSAGSLILACDNCGEEWFKGLEYFEHPPHWYVCMNCKTNGVKNLMQPILISELATKWYPFWKSLGHEIMENPAEEQNNV